MDCSPACNSFTVYVPETGRSQGAGLLAERDRMASCHPAARRPPAFRTGVRAAGINGYDRLRADCRSGRPPAIELTGVAGRSTHDR